MDSTGLPGSIVRIMGISSVIVTLWVSVVRAQDDFGGGDDAGGADLDLESMSGPEGGGGDGGEAALDKQGPPKSFLEETTLALQQLGLILGVAFMVAFLFLLMIGVEKAWEKMGEKYQEMTGKQETEEKDPASLVGTFSRYK